MWMWLLVKILIYQTFIVFLLEKIFFWNENFQISHMVLRTATPTKNWEITLKALELELITQQLTQKLRITFEALELE